MAQLTMRGLQRLIRMAAHLGLKNHARKRPRRMQIVIIGRGGHARLHAA